MSKNILKILNSVCEGWTVEHRFDSTNRYKFDFAHIRLKVVVEIEGGVWTGGGHTRGKGYLKDMKKYNLATLKGWLILRYTYGQEDDIADDIKKALERRRSDVTFKDAIEKIGETGKFDKKEI